MAELIMTDGKSMFVDYSKAAKIYQILQGKEEPIDEVQQAFCDRVSEVKFDDIPVRKTYSSNRRITEKDEKMQQILKDTEIKGYDKFLAVCKRIQERVAVSS